MIHDFPDWINAEERTQIGKFLQRIEFSRDIEEQPRKGKFSIHDMKTLAEYDIVKDSSDHESAKKYFLDLTKKYFDGKTPIEGISSILYSRLSLFSYHLLRKYLHRCTGSLFSSF